ncbi:hypothetical protein [Aquipuribacter hungaricus]|uniref:Uncharacterized protein n=2 Tax=Aquipuribacter hungaricus TaxID=545624 RepID=A0ABV7WIP7_9MICO
MAGAGALAAVLGLLLLTTDGSGLAWALVVMVVGVYAVGVPVSLRLRRRRTDADNWLLVEHLHAGLWWGGGTAAVLTLPGLFTGVPLLAAVVGAGLGGALAVVGALVAALVPGRARLAAAGAGPVVLALVVVAQLV